MHRFKYSDSKVIVKIFTEKFGLQSYMFFGANSKKGRMQINILQPLFPVNLQVYHKETIDLQKAKEASLMFPLYSISSDYTKHSISFFLAEFIYKVLKENDPDKELYSFLVNSLESFENLTVGSNNFHLLMLINLTKYLGIQPKNNYSDINKIFDLQAAKFMTGRPNHRDFLDEKLSQKFSTIIGTSISACSEIKILNTDRKALLDAVIKFYNIHLDRPGKLKSLEVLTQIFS